MKKIVVSILLIITIFSATGCFKKEKEKFLLNEKYYTSSASSDLDVATYNKLIENKESFGIFLYQPLCSVSYKFNKVLTEFSRTYQVSFYKMPFSSIKNTNLKDKIKYYPSFVIFHEGKLVDFLDAESNNDISHYESVKGFKKWFSNYVEFDESKQNENINIEEEIDENLKIDSVIENISYNENKINIYFFWGDGCPHCEDEFRFFESIKTEYGDYFVLNKFEVWHNEENKKLLKQFANSMGDEVTGVPYTIIGNETFSGFGEKTVDKMLEAIKNQYQNSYDVYFDKKVN